MSPAVDFLREPAPPTLLPAKGVLGPLKHHQGVAALSKAVFDSHIDGLRERVRAIQRFLLAYKPHLIVFPEYAIPAPLMPTARDMARQTNAIVVAGSHSVQLVNQSTYRAVGLNDLADDLPACVRKAVCPIFWPDGRGTVRFKVSPSKWEPDLVLHNGAQTPIEITIDGQSFLVDIRLCIDALATPAPSMDADLLVVPSWSPSVQPFSDLFGHALLRETASIYANCAFFGGSQVRTTGTGLDSREQFATIPEGEEAVLVVEIDLDRQFRTKGSTVPPFSERILCRAPVLYGAISDHAEAADALDQFLQAADDTDVEPLKILHGRRIPRTLKDTVDYARFSVASGVCTKDDREFIASHIFVPSHVVPFWTECVRCLSDAKTLCVRLLDESSATVTIAESIQKIAQALKKAGNFVGAVDIAPPTLLEAERERVAPFVDRLREQSALRDALRSANVIVVQGLPGMGKRSIARHVLRETFPRSALRVIQCAEGMCTDDLVRELEGAIGETTKSLMTKGAAAKRLTSAVVIVRDADIALDGAGMGTLSHFVQAIADTDIRVILLATRQLVLPALATARPVELRRLPAEDFQRVYQYWCTIEQVDSEPNIASKLHGYPLAAKIAARLHREGRSGGLTNVKFIQKIHTEVISVLLRDYNLSEQDRITLDAISVFRRPFQDDVLSKLGIDAIEDRVDALENRFLVEREGSTIYVMPLVRDIAEQSSSKQGIRRDYHAVAAAYYEERLKADTAFGKYEANSEAIFHHTACGNLKRARELGSNWQGFARAAREELWRRRRYSSCAEVCHAISEASGELRDNEERLLLCLARLARWGDARKKMETLKKYGWMSNRILVGYAEVLLAKGIVDEGRKILEAVYEQEEDNAYVRAALSAYYFDRQEFKRAMDLAGEALEIDNNELRALDIAARVARHEKDFESAYRYARRAMELRPSRAEHTYNRVLSSIRKAYKGAMPPFVRDD